jgi:hypothetical protein
VPIGFSLDHRHQFGVACKTASNGEVVLQRRKVNLGASGADYFGLRIGDYGLPNIQLWILIQYRLAMLVIPAKAGIQASRTCLDTGLRRYDSGYHNDYFRT